MNIVNQLADLWEVNVDVRQATNDQADAFVTKLLELYCHKQVIELADYVDELIDKGYRTDTNVGVRNFKKMVRDRAELRKTL